MYWSPTTRSHEVYGAIFTAWGGTGWEAGPLGYPVSGEYGVAGGRRSDFQNGYITWTPRSGAVAVYPGSPPPPSPTAGSIVLTGTGTNVVNVNKPAGPMLVRLRTTGPTTSNFIAYSRHGTEQGSLLANEIGVTDQVVPLDFGARPAPPTTAFQVRSDTSWEITLIPLSATGIFGKGGTIGESRSTVWHYVGAASTARLTNNATTGNFIVIAYNADTGYSELLVNEIGAFDGHVPIKANQYLEIKSDGPWAIIVV